MKKGQVMLFIILGMLLLVISMIIVYLATFHKVPWLRTATLEDKAMIYVRGCVHDSVVDAVLKFTLTGGGMGNGSGSVERDGIYVRYGRSDDMLLVPSADITKAALGKEINQTIYGCMLAMSDVMPEMNITHPATSISVDLQDGALDVLLDLNMTITEQDDTVHHLHGLRYMYPVNLKELLFAATVIINDSLYGLVDLSVYNFTSSGIQGCFEDGEFLRLTYSQQDADQLNFTLQLATDTPIGDYSCTLQ